jgi:hypothetical protein
LKTLALVLALLAAGPPPYEKASKLALWQRVVVCDGVVQKRDSDVLRLENKLATRTATVINQLVVPPAPEPIEVSGIATPWAVVIGIGGLVVGVVGGIWIASKLDNGPDVIVAK